MSLTATDVGGGLLAAFSTLAGHTLGAKWTVSSLGVTSASYREYDLCGRAGACDTGTGLCSCVDSYGGPACDQALTTTSLAESADTQPVLSVVASSLSYTGSALAISSARVQSAGFNYLSISDPGGTFVTVTGDGVLKTQGIAADGGTLVKMGPYAAASLPTVPALDVLQAAPTASATVVATNGVLRLRSDVALDSDTATPPGPAASSYDLLSVLAKTTTAAAGYTPLLSVKGTGAAAFRQGTVTVTDSASAPTVTTHMGTATAGLTVTASPATPYAAGGFTGLLVTAPASGTYAMLSTVRSGASTLSIDSNNDVSSTDDLLISTAASTGSGIKMAPGANAGGVGGSITLQAGGGTTSGTVQIVSGDGTKTLSIDASNDITSSDALAIRTSTLAVGVAPGIALAAGGSSGGTGGSITLQPGAGATPGTLRLLNGAGTKSLTVDGSADIESSDSLLISVATSADATALGIVLAAGANTGTGGTDSGGSVTISAGAAAAGSGASGGSITLQPGDGDTQGSIVLRSADGSARVTVPGAAGSAVAVTTGLAVSATGALSDPVVAIAGPSTGTYNLLRTVGVSGATLILDQGSDVWSSDDLLISSNDVAAASGSTRHVTVRAGIATGGASGGSLTLAGGVPSATAVGGNVVVAAGGLGTAATGGSVFLRPGDGAAPGSIVLQTAGASPSDRITVPGVSSAPVTVVDGLSVSNSAVAAGVLLDVHGSGAGAYTLLRAAGAATLTVTKDADILSSDALGISTADASAASATPGILLAAGTNAGAGAGGSIQLRPGSGGAATSSVQLQAADSTARVTVPASAAAAVVIAGPAQLSGDGSVDVLVMGSGATTLTVTQSSDLISTDALMLLTADGADGATAAGIKVAPGTGGAGGVGGSVTLVGGDAGTGGTGGSVMIQPGASDTAGDVVLAGSAGTSRLTVPGDAASPILVAAGSGPALRIISPSGSSTLTVDAGNDITSSDALSIRTAEKATTGVSAGILIEAGTGTGGASGGSITLQAGVPTGDGGSSTAGSVNIFAGGIANGNGGSVFVRSGASGGANAGTPQIALESSDGSVRLSVPGSASAPVAVSEGLSLTTGASFTGSQLLITGSGTGAYNLLQAAGTATLTVDKAADITSSDDLSIRGAAVATAAAAPSVLIAAGANTYGGVGASDGGSVTLLAGASQAAAGGSIALQPGDGVVAGSVLLRSAAGTARVTVPGAAASPVVVSEGLSLTATTGAAGGQLLVTGPSTGSAYTLFKAVGLASAALSVDSSGDVLSSDALSIATQSSADSGISIAAGAGASGANGGSLTLQAGTPDAGHVGGSVLVTAGGSGAGSTGGSVVLQPGGATLAAGYGSVAIKDAVGKERLLVTAPATSVLATDGGAVVAVATGADAAASSVVIASALSLRSTLSSVRTGAGASTLTVDASNDIQSTDLLQITTAAPATGNAAGIILAAAAGGSVGNGGALTLLAGAPATGQTGGDIQLSAGGAALGATGGSVLLQPGRGVAPGSTQIRDASGYTRLQVDSGATTLFAGASGEIAALTLTHGATAAASAVALAGPLTVAGLLTASSGFGKGLVTFYPDGSSINTGHPDDPAVTRLTFGFNSNAGAITVTYGASPVYSSTTAVTVPAGGLFPIYRVP
jgi:hypothetical protein